MAKVLQGFVQVAIRTTKQEKIKFIVSNTNTTPTPAPITRMSQYPATELTHKQFFQHHLNNRRTHLTVWYSVITKLDIHTFKNRMMPYVRDKLFGCQALHWRQESIKQQLGYLMDTHIFYPGNYW